MPKRVRRKWRPTLGMVVFIVLTTVVALPLVGLFFFRLYENQLVRQTKSELIAQTAVLAAAFASEVEKLPALKAKLVQRPASSQVSRVGPEEPGGREFHPIEAGLDLTADDVRLRRPDAREAAAQPDPAFLEIGKTVYGLAVRAQDVTLAGFRILDPEGTVIAGHDEIGKSLAHVEEVAAALRGSYGSVLRVRVSTSPPPPLYSMSRGTGIRVFVAMPVIVDNALAGVIYASRTPTNIFKNLYGERGKVEFAALAVMAATLLIGFLFSRTITRPIHGLIDETRRIGNGGGEAKPLRRHGTREIAMLSQSFLDMAERLSERSGYIRTFAAHVSHELKSPLTSIQGAAELLKDASASRMSEAQRQRFLDNIIGDTQRLTRLLERLRELARADNPQDIGETTLAAVVAKAREAFPILDIAAAGDQQVAFGMSQENAVIILSHLLDNAARHKARKVRIEGRSCGELAAITVSDDGDGISESNRQKIFEPFFTTRRESGGTGMGLGIVRSMLRSHGGAIALEPGKEGTSFKITIPLVVSVT